MRRRHSAQLKAQVLAECAEPGASVAKVAMSHALNANIVHGWRKFARERDGPAVLPPSPAALPARSAASMPQFVPVSMAPTPPQSAPADIRIELRRGATLMKITWPIAAAADCAAWMRELLR
ncbi:transposase [Methylibium sp.]|uniref:IS66-like element accessory protein TnpA n=1 Tax=Methylibium sp. TaxID=2067992 RepID=UPI0025ED779D|nr:transposase [Methylibium sp.]